MGDAFERGAPLYPSSFPLLALMASKPKAKLGPGLRSFEAAQRSAYRGAERRDQGQRAA